MSVKVVAGPACANRAHRKSRKRRGLRWIAADYRKARRPGNGTAYGGAVSAMISAMKPWIIAVLLALLAVYRFGDLGFGGQLDAAAHAVRPWTDADQG